MNIKISYEGVMVGVYDDKNIYAQPLFIKVSNGDTDNLFSYLLDGHKVVFIDEDGSSIEFEVVLLWEGLIAANEPVYHIGV